MIHFYFNFVPMISMEYFFRFGFSFFSSKKEQTFFTFYSQFKLFEFKKIVYKQRYNITHSSLTKRAIEIFRSKNKLKVMTQYGKKRTICAKCFVVKNKKK